MGTNTHTHRHIHSIVEWFKICVQFIKALFYRSFTAFHFHFMSNDAFTLNYVRQHRDVVNKREEKKVTWKSNISPHFKPFLAELWAQRTIFRCFRVARFWFCLVNIFNFLLLFSAQCIHTHTPFSKCLNCNWRRTIDLEIEKEKQRKKVTLFIYTLRPYSLHTYSLLRVAN